MVKFEFKRDIDGVIILTYLYNCSIQIIFFIINDWYVFLMDCVQAKLSRKSGFDNRICKESP